ncbi:Crp/Fnr family transcriptional regulator [Niabella aquatica]
MEQLFKKLYQHPLFTEAELQTLAAAHEPVEVTKGSIILREGKMANEYYVLQKGLARAYVYDYNNDEITTEFFTEGELVISTSSLFQRTLSQENIQTVTDCVLWKMEFESFQKLFHAMPGLVEWGRLWFTSQLFIIKQRSLDMVRETATNRYLKLLKEKPEIIQYVPLKQIASYLGVTDTSLSRIRKDISV